MKKFVLLLAIVVILSGCAIKTSVSEGMGIPSQVSEIHFYNGGLEIGTYTDATVRMEIHTNSKVVGNAISFYIYKITSGGKTESIMDSEALSAKWIE